MNISHPIATTIKSVNFLHLRPDEIRAISVKQIQNPVTFDTLLHPTPGGLYDPALGAFGDNACGTCHLNTYNCPGHSGHIELPVPVYHLLFLPQLFILLRCKCVYCGHFRLAKSKVDLFRCKFELLESGLVSEVAEVEEFISSSEKRDVLKNGQDANGDADMDSGDDTDDEETLEEKRSAFVRERIRLAGGPKLGNKWQKIEYVASKNREVFKDFLADAVKVKACENCDG